MKTKTNFKRLQSLSIEQLADELAENNTCSFCEKTETQTCNNITCKQGVLQYLKSEEHFDRLKALSIEKLADELAKDNTCSFCKKTDTQFCDNITCKQGILQFLESEAL